MGAHDRANRGRIGGGFTVRSGDEGRSVKVKLDRKVLYELDGGDRTKVKAFKVEVEPGAVSVCVSAAPLPETSGSPGPEARVGVGG